MHCMGAEKRKREPIAQRIIDVGRAGFGSSCRTKKIKISWGFRGALGALEQERLGGERRIELVDFI